MDFLAANSGIIGLLFFFGAFCGIGYLTLRPASRESIEAHKFIPLAED